MEYKSSSRQKHHLIFITAHLALWIQGGCPPVLICDLWGSWPHNVPPISCAGAKFILPHLKLHQFGCFPLSDFLKHHQDVLFFFSFGKPAEGCSFTVKMGEQSNWKKSPEWRQSAAGIASAKAAWKFWLPKGLQSSRAFQELPGNANRSFWSKSKLKFWGKCEYIKTLIQCEVPVGGAEHRLWIFRAAHPCPYFVLLKNNRSEEVTTNLLAELSLEFCAPNLRVGMMVFGLHDLGELLQP